MTDSSVLCPACGEQRHRLVPADAVPASGRAALEAAHPDWDPDEGLCDNCVGDAKVGSMRTALLADGRITEDEAAVLDSIRTDSLVTTEEDFDGEDRQDRFVNRIAATIGSWPVFAAVFVFLVVWIGLNLISRPFEPYPVIIFAVTSAVLASLAALEGPIIIMAQRRQRLLDRERARADYRVNLKAELEIRYLDDKVELLLASNRELRSEVRALRDALGGDSLPESDPLH